MCVCMYVYIYTYIYRYVYVDICIYIHTYLYIFPWGQNITYMVWDTAGQEEFDALTKQYYRNAQGCVIAFSSVPHRTNPGKIWFR